MVQYFYKKMHARNSLVSLMRLSLLLAVVVLISALQAPLADAGRVIWSPSTTLQDVAVGVKATCAVAGNVPYCWGTNTYNNLGNSTVALDALEYYPVPVDMSGALAGKTVTKIASGNLTYFCVIADGKPYCWGRNSYGMFGDGTTTSSSVPVATIATGALSGKTVTDISAGDGHTCAVADGRAYCWGTNGQGRLGDTTGTTRLEPTAVYTGGVLGSKTVTSISAESGTSCAVADGKVYCWGFNGAGQIGDGTTTGTFQPVATGVGTAMASETIVKVSSANSGACALAASGNVYCWGRGTSGELGNGSTSGSLTPVKVVGSLVGKTVIDLAVGQWRPCALDSDTKPHCWGNGYLGDGSTGAKSSPVQVTTTGVLAGVTLLRVSDGDERVSCAQSTNVTYCWGFKSELMGTGIAGAATVPNYVRSIESLGTSAYRFYENVNSSTPGDPIDAPNTVTKLQLPGQKFRLRMDVNAGTHGIAPSDNTFKLQYAKKTVATCSAQTTGFVAVSNSTPIAYSTNAGVANGADITAYVEDPVPGVSVAPQTYQSTSGTFTSSQLVDPAKKGLWDFSLIDNGATADDSYCLRMTYSDSTPLESSTQYPEVRIATPELSVSIVDASGDAVGSPSYSLSNGITQSSCQTTTGTFGASSQRIRVFNSLASTAWSLSIAATNGATASWQKSGGGSSYDFNDSSGSPAGCNSGGDGDGIAGQLSINPSGASIAAKSGCSMTGISKGSSTAFSQGSTDAISLADASSSAQFGCYWEFTGFGMSQKIPAFQDSGMYEIDMTLTAVAV